MKQDTKELDKKDKNILELYKYYKKIFASNPKPKAETLEDSIERINPYYIRNKSINYVGE